MASLNRDDTFVSYRFITDTVSNPLQEGERIAKSIMDLSVDIEFADVHYVKDEPTDPAVYHIYVALSAALQLTQRKEALRVVIRHLVNTGLITSDAAESVLLEGVR